MLTHICYLDSGSSFGAVYKARHKHANFVIALKELEMDGMRHPMTFFDSRSQTNNKLY
jgi:hypothetical protein